MRIGELAQVACVSPSIIRYYETIGLIPHPPRGASGHRIYSTAEADRICLITGARLAGMTVPEIRQLLMVQDDGVTPSPQLLGILENKLSEVRKRMQQLQRLEVQLQFLCSLSLGRALLSTTYIPK